jgi:hypothetical protein
LEAVSALTVIFNADPAVAVVVAGTTEKWVAGDVCPPLPQPRSHKPQIEISRIRGCFITSFTSFNPALNCGPETRR